MVKGSYIERARKKNFKKLLTIIFDCANIDLSRSATIEKKGFKRLGNPFKKLPNFNFK